MPAFLDTNVFLYAAGRAHPQKLPCQAVLRRIGEGRLRATTSTEVVQEIAYVLTRRGRRGDGVRLARRVLALFPDLLPVTHDDMALACDCLDQNPHLPSRDAVHVATMRNAGITTIISADRDFDAFEDIRRFDPRDRDW